MTNEDKKFIAHMVKLDIKRKRGIRSSIHKLKAYGFQPATIRKYYKSFSK